MELAEKIKYFDDRCVIVAYLQLIDPLEVKNLEDPAKNKKLYLKSKKESRNLLHTITPTVKLYFLDDKFMVFDDTNQEILYEMRFEIHKIFGYEFAVQSFVWSSPSLINFTIKGQNVSSYVFFNFLMNAAGGIAIATDAFHTPSGRQFWLRRVAQAFHKNQHVYLIDMTKNIKIKIKTHNEFRDKINELEMWTKKEEGQIRRVIISPTVLW